MTRTISSADPATSLPISGGFALPGRRRLEARHMLGAMGALIVLAYPALPSGWAQAIAYQVVGLLPILGVAIGLWLHRPARAMPWVLLAVAQFCFTMGDGIWTFNELVLGTSPFPSVADAVYLAAYPFIAAACLLLVRERIPGAEHPRLLDAAIIAVGFGIVSWIAFIQPIATDAGVAPLDRLVSIAYPIMDVLLLGIVARLAIVPGTRLPSHRLLILSFALLFAADTAFSMLNAGAGYASGAPLDLVWLASYVVLAVAATHPSIAAPVQRYIGPTDGGLTGRRLVILAAASLVGPLALLGEVTLTQLEDLPLALATLAVTGLVVLRLAGLTGTLRRSEQRFRTLVQNASDVYSILAPDGTNLYESEAVTRVLGYRPEELVGRNGFDLVHPDDQAYVRQLFAELLTAPGLERAAELRLRRATNSWCRVELVAKNLIADAAVRGIVINYRDVTQRHALEEQLKHQAFHDPLTGLANRALFSDRLQNALDRRTRRAGPPAPLAVLFLDLDDFKAVNDGLGHGAGDELLTAVGERLESCLRAGDTAARVGGDEFAILLDERVTVRVAEGVATRVLEALRSPFDLHGRALVMRASIGIAMAGLGPEASDVDAGAEVDDADVVLRNADVAMYQAKLGGKGRYEIFAREMHGAAIARLQLRTDLEAALERGELEMVYQPIVSIASGEIAGVEALLRWHHAEQGTLLPSTFLVAAEETGLLVPIGRWGLDDACRQAAEWRRQGTWRTSDGAQRLMSVNLSVSQLRDRHLVENVRRALDEHQLAPGSLVLEITESALLDDTEERIAELRALKDLGVLLAIDDFGIGYSSFSYLRRLPVDILKLDRSFVVSIDTRTDDRIVANAILDLGRTLGMRVIAEGIETAAQRDVLADLGCELGQGYLFGRAASAHEATRRIRD